MRCLLLPFRFDPEKLRADLARVEPAEWIPHQNRRHYDGQWSGAALRSIGGAADTLVPDAPDIADFRATALLARCEYFREVLATFRCPLQAVRLLRLHAGSKIAEHVDRALEFEDGEVRLHVPVITHDEVKFFLDGARLVMAPGECWYTNVNLPHSVENHGAIDRVHLVIDCRVDAWLRELFARTPRPPCVHYGARLIRTSAPATVPLLEFFSGWAAARSSSGPDVQFRPIGTTFVLSWRGTHTWQLRLRLPATATTGDWRAEVESSPDPEWRHRSDYAGLLEQFGRAFPATTVETVGFA